MTYVEAIQNDGSFCIENAVTNMSVLENTRAVEDAGKVYKEQVEGNASLPIDDDQLARIHGNALECALKIFFDKAVFDFDGEFQEKLNVGYIII